MRRLAILIIVILWASTSFAQMGGFSPIQGGSGSVGSTVDNGTIDSRIDQAVGGGTITSISIGDGNITLDDNGTIKAREYALKRTTYSDTCYQYMSRLGGTDFGHQFCAPSAGFVEALRFEWPTASPTAGQTYSFSAPDDGVVTVRYVEPGSTTAVTQASHGFAVGDVLKRASGSYAKAQADSAANAEVVGIVSAVPTDGTFVLTAQGRITGLTGLTDATLYYLDPSTAGALTATQPTSTGQIVKPLLIASGTTSGYFVNMRGNVLQADYSSDNATAMACDSYYYSAASKTVFTAPTYAKGCQVCLRQGSNRTDVLKIVPPTDGVLEPSAKTALCSANESLVVDGSAAVTDMICIVGSDTADTFHTWSVSGTWVCQ